MNLKIEIFFIVIIGYMILGCKDSKSNPVKDSNLCFKENKIILSPKDSTLELIDSCMTKEYKVKLEEYINLDSNAFILTLFKDGIQKTHILDHPPGRTKIENCTRDFIIFNSYCGGPCTAKDFLFFREERPIEGYMFCHIANNNDNIITHHANEEFEVLKIRNLKNSKEMSVYIGPCYNEISYPCGISNLKVHKNKLFITFDSPENNPKQKEINIHEILK